MSGWEDLGILELIRHHGHGQVQKEAGPILNMFLEHEIGFEWRILLNYILAAGPGHVNPYRPCALPCVHMIALQWHAGPENDCVTESVHTMQGLDELYHLAKFINGEPCQMPSLLKLHLKDLIIWQGLLNCNLKNIAIWPGSFKCNLRNFVIWQCSLNYNVRYLSIWQGSLNCNLRNFVIW